MARRGEEPAWRKPCLTNLAETGNVTNSCYVAKITRPGAYKSRNNDEAFAEAWDVAEEDAIQKLELEARRRAYEGVQKPVFHAGEEYGRINQYSDVLMMFCLRRIVLILIGIVFRLIMAARLILVGSRLSSFVSYQQRRQLTLTIMEGLETMPIP